MRVRSSCIWALLPRLTRVSKYENPKAVSTKLVDWTGTLDTSSSLNSWVFWNSSYDEKESLNIRILEKGKA